jgi:hypothetical protein
VRYVNSGFGCPSTPDLERELDPHAVTFSVIDTTERTAAVWGVDLDLGCRPVDGPPPASPWPRPGPLLLRGHRQPRPARRLELVRHTTSGTYVVPPPERVPAGAVARFWLQDNPGAAGSSGTATYRRTTADVHGEPDGEVTLRYACPTIGRNAASGTERWAARVGDGPWKEQQVEAAAARSSSASTPADRDVR